MAIAKKFENTPILPNFNTDPFLTSKLILKGSYAFVFFSTIDKNKLSDMKIYNSLIQKAKM